MSPLLTIKWKLRHCRSRKQKRKDKTITMFDSGHCNWLVLPLLLPAPTTEFSLVHKRRSRKRNRKKWKRSDSSDSDSVELMTLLTTPIFDFHQVISSLMTPTTTLTPTPSLVKTRSSQINWNCTCCVTYARYRLSWKEETCLRPGMKLVFLWNFHIVIPAF